MANDVAGISWDTSVPALGDDRREGQQEIRALRVGVEVRMNREHADMAPASVGGEHSAGSAKAYFQDDSPAPTNRPDGATALDANDSGRLWNDTTAGNVLRVWTGAAFASVSGIQIATGNFTGAALDASEAGGPIVVAVGFVCDLFLLLVPIVGETNHYQFTVPLRDDAIIVGVYSSTPSNQIVVDFERDGTNVEVQQNSDSTSTADGTCQWMAFNFS